MQIAIAGSTGFLGKQLSEYFLRSGNELIAISRQDFAGGINHLSKVINSADVIINLAGSSVLTRWTKKNKNLIRSSRIGTTRLLVAAALSNESPRSPRLFINASAIGIYENNGNHDEYSSSLGSGFLASVCKDWEGESILLKDSGTRLCTIRIGVVLGITGGPLQKMLPIFKAGLGGKIGSGLQPFSFIHVTDFCRAIEHLIFHDPSSGVYNLVSPLPTSNKLFTNTLSVSLHRPAFFTVPVFALKLFYGEASGILTQGTCAVPARLLTDDFQFQFPDISSAIKDLVNK
jgi:uncharacterized protein (TIGR01777 family)